MYLYVQLEKVYFLQKKLLLNVMSLKQFYLHVSGVDVLKVQCYC